MRSSAIALFAACLLILCSGCAAVEERLDKQGATGCLDCESRCWPPGRPGWTNKCLCEPWIEACRSTKLPICSPCDRKRAREAKAQEAAEAVHDVPETSVDIP